MDITTRNLIDRMTDALMQLAHDERELGRALRAADEHGRSEAAFYVADAVNSHPNRPAGISTSLDRVEKFIGWRLQVEDWHVRSDALDDEWRDLQAAVALLDDGDYDEDDLTG